MIVFFLEQKKQFWYRALRSKTELVHFGSGIRTSGFFYGEKKRQSLWKSEYVYIAISQSCIHKAICICMHTYNSIYIHIYTYIHTRTYQHSHTYFANHINAHTQYVHVHSNVRIHSYLDRHIYIKQSKYACTHITVYIYIHIYTYIHVPISTVIHSSQISTCIHIHTYLHTYIHTYIHTRTYQHSHTQLASLHMQQRSAWLLKRVISLHESAVLGTLQQPRAPVYVCMYICMCIQHGFQSA